jgi:hypothetical protein
MSQSLDLYWNPVPHVEAALQSSRLGVSPHPPDLLFVGKWDERNWRNVPGPLYGAQTDNCWVGRIHAPRHILYGSELNGSDVEYEQEFLYRQPRTPAELGDVLDGMSLDPCAGWAYDGDTNWTPDLVRGWWRDSPRLRQWITQKRRTWADSERDDEREAAEGLSDYLAYLDGELPDHLRVYMYFLDHHRSPTNSDLLPRL